MRILKFGGKSLSTTEKMQKIAKNIKKIYENDKKIIIVVSAMGDDTNSLFKLASGFKENKLELAKLVSLGEMKSSAMMSIILNNAGVKSKSVCAADIGILTFGDPLNSKIAYINKSKILKLMENDTVLVVTGFQGVDKNGNITLLGRGGSDTTASAIGAIFGVSPEIYSNFDGVFCGDPKIMNYKKIKSLSYDSMINMARLGAKVIEKRAAEIAQNFKINIISKSSTEMGKKGTLIGPIEDSSISISTIENLCQIGIVFSDESLFEKISKNVLFLLKDIKFYNLNISKCKIVFEIEGKNKNEIIYALSKKLNLLSKKLDS
ncbi:MAG: hypothetical protein IJ538_03345 [Clostridia bacterium]|nr:hypothetical protein [Clostridia bacterium]